MPRTVEHELAVFKRGVIELHTERELKALLDKSIQEDKPLHDQLWLARRIGRKRTSWRRPVTATSRPCRPPRARRACTCRRSRGRSL